MENRYDIAIVGSGPAGLSAAINAKVRNKNIILFGSKNLSEKLAKAHEVNNYLGMYGKSGSELIDAFRFHVEQMNIEITNERVTNILPMGEYYSLLTKDGMYEATSIILTSGVTFGKPIPGEKEYLGKGVSYCATCDAMFYRGKEAAVIGFCQEDEEDVDFLARVAKKVYYIPMYKEDVKVSSEVEIIRDNVVAIRGSQSVDTLVLNNRELTVDGVFILRDSVSADQLVPGLEVKDNHVLVNRLMETNLQGCFAAGDIVGKPYQYIKAAGDGNVAALSAVSYVDKLSRENKHKS